MPEKIIARIGLGDPRPGSAYHHDVGLDEGNHLGYISTCLWPSQAVEGSDERWYALRDRLAALIESDTEIQDILRAEKQARAEARL